MDRRLQFARLPTPLEPARRFSQLLGREIWIKRDDLTGLGMGGGNKARKLELLAAQAIAERADTLIGVGAPQSNHARSVAAAAAANGLRAELVLTGMRPDRPTGNLLLDQLYGANLHFTGSEEWTSLKRASDELAHELRLHGRRPHQMPVGGSSPLGVAAFVAAYLEARAQWHARGLKPRTILHASSSGGTQAGLELGRAIMNDEEIAVVGIDVAKITGDLREEVIRLAKACAAILDLSCDGLKPTVLSNYLGDGYAVPSSSVARTIETLATTEGVITDPVYSGKALVAISDPALKPPIIFWHTGGSPALFSDELGMTRWRTAGVG
jgi:D-cysteine desulfhydrase family pyridoxal phosphate-dependent enzyme